MENYRKSHRVILVNSRVWHSVPWQQWKTQR